jgi:hypothetical protein
MEYELPRLSQIHKNFLSTGISSMDTANNLYTGRPFGGLAFLWSKELTCSPKPVFFGDNKRIMGLELTFADIKYLLVNIYMPYCCPSNLDEFVQYLSRAESIMSEANTPYVYLIGDFNADPRGSHLFGTELSEFCKEMNLIMADAHFLDGDCYTYVSEAHNTTSWLDHVICTANSDSLIDSLSILYDKVSSDHMPLSFSINASRVQCKMIQTHNRQTSHRQHVVWDKVNSRDLEMYKACTQHLLRDIQYNDSLTACTDPQCQLSGHIIAINNLYDKICDTLHSAGTKLISPTSHGYKHIPGWNDCCKEAHSQARDAFLLWRANDSPKQGFFFHEMRTTRAHFKLILRQCKRSADRKTADSLACKLLMRNTKEFWKHIQNVNCKNITPVATTIADVSGSFNICEMWHDYFKDTLNSSTNACVNNLAFLQRLHPVGNSSTEVFTADEVQCALKRLKKNSSTGNDGLSSEHFVYAHESLSDYLTVLFNCMLTHNYIPQKFMDTLIVPLLKEKKGNITDKDNYRPIAITCVFSKILESVLLEKYKCYCNTSYNQFGYKSKHSTDQCIFIIKEMIDYYNTSNSPLYICFIDASKAFDRLDHVMLFDKLLNRGVPQTVVRLLCTWYTHQQFFVKWCDCVSQPFTASNGVRQGGSLSPIMFNVFMNDLSVQLSNTKIGCFKEDICYNHLFYADDTVLLAPSPSALQKLLDVCEQYGVKHNIVYNPKKSVCMAFLPKRLVNCNIPTMLFNGKALDWVDEHKYLGFYMTSNRSDEKDMTRQLRSIYARGNVLVRNFHHCSPEVKLTLFRAYCYNVYCGHLWARYTKRQLQKLIVAYNNVFRNLFDIKHRCSMSQLYMYNNVCSFTVLLRKSIVNFRTRIHVSENPLIKCMLKSPFYNHSNLFKIWSKFIF